MNTYTHHTNRHLAGSDTSSLPITSLGNRHRCMFYCHIGQKKQISCTTRCQWQCQAAVSLSWV